MRLCVPALAFLLFQGTPQQEGPFETAVVDGRTVYFFPVTETLRVPFVKIPAGRFLMGTPEEEPGREPDETLHEVTITKDFYLMATEVTQEFWSAIMGYNPSKFRGARNPVECIHPKYILGMSGAPGQVGHMVGFVEKLNDRFKDRLCGLQFRLPTEAEWEYAARAGTQGPWHFGANAAQLTDFAWYSENSGGSPHPVAQKKPNEWGLYDMHGNVWEVVRDKYEPYPTTAQTDPIVPGNPDPAKGERLVLRGGSWLSAPGLTRCGRRYWYRYHDIYGIVGFRLALQ